MAPLVPIFDILEAMLAVKDFAEAVPGVISNPSALASATADLIEKITGLAALVPQFSVPFMVLDLIDLMISALNGAITQLDAYLIQEAKIAAAIVKANEEGNGSLLTVTACAEALQVKTLDGIQEGLGPLNTFLGLLNIFLGLLGLDPVPDLADLPEDAQDAIDALRDVVKLLGDLRDTIPVP